VDIRCAPAEKTYCPDEDVKDQESEGEEESQCASLGTSATTAIAPGVDAPLDIAHSSLDCCSERPRI
jgi:hypothetical protein